MNVVDSSAWLSYFAGDANAGVFSKPIEAIDQLIAKSECKWGDEFHCFLALTPAPFRVEALDALLRKKKISTIRYAATL